MDGDVLKSGRSIGLGMLTWSVRCLLVKDRDLNLIPQSTQRKAGMVVFVVSELGRQRHGRPCSLRARETKKKAH